MYSSGPQHIFFLEIMLGQWMFYTLGHSILLRRCPLSWKKWRATTQNLHIRRWRKHTWHYAIVTEIYQLHTSVLKSIRGPLGKEEIRDQGSLWERYSLGSQWCPSRRSRKWTAGNAWAIVLFEGVAEEYGSKRLCPIASEPLISLLSLVLSETMSDTM